ncbi:hypothetical protein QBC41DRAFT_314090 [Cercophora samala]|uniref:Uncharacterized protein n=1 Tax=Cercophora samala TaxID=330535 RepID=A0AA39ZJL4_9PEZI|nr:hypothetical protein QBC41DRAFT_314090 [Cercophora samala]
MWTTSSRRDDSATPLPLPLPPPPRPPTSSSSSFSSSSHPYPTLSSPGSEHPQPVYRVYPPDSLHHHHHHHHHQQQQHHIESEYCHARRSGSPTSASTTAAPWDNPMVDLPFVDYAQVEIQSQSIKVIRSPLSLVKSVASRLPTSPYMLARAVSTYATRSRSSSPPAAEAPAVVAAPPLPRRPRIEEGYSTGVAKQGRAPSMAARAGESESGVNWDYGSQGMAMLSLARQASSTPDLERMNYINSVLYLGKALPADLTPAEASTIRQSMPAAVVGPQPNDYFGAHQGNPVLSKNKKNYIHQISLIILNWLHALMQVAIPFTRQTISRLARFERENQLFSNMAMASFKGAKNAYVWFSGAYAGKLIAELIAWIFEGVHGAFTEFREKSDAMTAHGGRGYQNHPQPSMTPEDWERRRMYEHQRAQQQGWPPQHYQTDFAPLSRQGL